MNNNTKQLKKQQTIINIKKQLKIIKKKRLQTIRNYKKQ